MAFANDEHPQPDKTEVLHGNDVIIKKTLETFSWTKKSMDGSLDKDGPAVHVLYEPIWNGLVSLKKKGIMIRGITEVTVDNILYCKKLMEVGDLRHLDGVRTNFGIADKKQVLFHGISRESDPISQSILTSVKGLVEAQQYMFENLWNKAIPAEDKIKEIEEGIEPLQTKILENPEEIYKRFLDTIKKSNERCVCSSIGGMQIIYNNFFNLYKEIIEKQKRGEGSGIKWLTFIDNNKNSIDLVTKFLDAGIQVRHIKNLPSMNFSFNRDSTQATIKSMEDGKFMDRLLISNEPAYVKHFTSYFQDLWDNYGIDAQERIKDIEEGMDYDIEVIRHSDRVWDLYLDLIESAQNEIFFIFPTPRAFIRQLKAIYLAKLVSRDRKAKVRILTPSNELVEESIKRLVEEDNDVQKRENMNYHKNKLDMDSFFNSNIKIRFIEKMSNTKATIVVVDRKHSLVMELKDDSKDSYSQAIGQSIHSTSKAGVLSYVSIFENLWRQSELYHEIKESNERLKINDRMQKEFINTAAHELRTPLQPIISLSQLLKDRTKDKKQKVLLDIVIKNAKRLKELTEDILDVTKIEGGTLNLNKNALNIVDLLQSIIKDFEHGIENSKGIKFEMHFKDVDSNTIVFADRNRIIQVISNLIDNSIKFIMMRYVNGLISINVEKTKINNKENESSNKVIDGIIISIKDNGKGIDPEIFPRLFTKFASSSFQGTGLGLFIAKNIIEAHGGKIWAQNNGYGESGATFFFSIPLAIQQQST